MIKGKIEDGLHPKIRVEVSGKLALNKYSALVDTGFDMDLALHHAEAPALGLKIAELVRVDYASGESNDESVCLARVLWHGKWKKIKISLSNDEEPAIGTRLLQDSVVTLNFGNNRLTIEEFAKLQYKIGASGAKRSHLRMRREHAVQALTIDHMPTRKEIDSYGKAADKIYAPLSSKLEAEHWGKYITIHPVTGDYAIGRTLNAADKKLRKKYPDIAFVAYRIGYKAVARR